ncbi:hypothetical protein C8046_16630 [Serinibacter arcticus]|uniref:Antitoxin VbhA domain-containing protein n=1 Tax=Serinibacter arcticus TaxID=1655435 RepID=A0A2U1ZYF7_9MICO|nr:antitoxin VbhA family protein [Serinibacter arcticus]PWD52025.1 hypothetical protein C8046_16630 [Serinibacter arcticus]
MTMLPEPACEMGYSLQQVEDVVGAERLPAFRAFMMMRAHATCPGHGEVFFPFDVGQFVERVTRADDTDLKARREAMIDIVASWHLDGSRPNAAGMAILRDYVAGEIDFEEMFRRMTGTGL